VHFQPKLTKDIQRQPRNDRQVKKDADGPDVF